MNPFLRALMPVLAALCLLSGARAQTVTILSQLGGNPNGYAPQTPLVKGPDGTLYGTTASGGPPNFGTIYKVSTAGKVATIHSFSGGANGSTPMAGLIFGKDGNLYGTTTRGGSAGNGTVFRVTTAGALTVLHSFSAFKFGRYGPNVDGGTPQAGLLLGTDGNFYGTTPAGGSDGDGTVFKMTPSGAFTTLHNFVGNSTADIFAPTTGLVQGTDGNFYGTAQGGDDNYDGAIFKMTPAGVVTRIHQFTGGKGGNAPGALVRGKDGNFYGLSGGGVTSSGAAAYGTAFKITPAGVLTTLHTFDYKVEGGAPAGALFQAADGNFYGTASSGGPANGTPYYGYGTIFKMTPAGVVSLVYTFNYTSGINGDTFNGATPMAGVVRGSDGNFYGTTAGGGQGNAATNFTGNGTVFRLTPAGALTTLFRGVAGGTQCFARLVESPTGNFYGTTYRGGASNIGTIFGVTPTGQLVTEYSFDDAVTGAYPNGGMTTDGKGNYFGFTGIDGPSGWGCLFEASEVAATPADEGAGNEPAGEFVNPLPRLKVARKQKKPSEHKTSESGGENQAHGSDDHSEHGHHMTYSRKRGGYIDTDNGQGDVEDDDVYDPDDIPARQPAFDTVPTVRYTFTGGDDGGEPLGALYIDASNNVFGTTSLGGTHGQGTVFQLTPGNVLKTLYHFQGDTDGVFPAAGLIKGTDGNYYGTTAYTSYDSGTFSSTGYGTIFRLTPGGVLTTLHTFDGNADGGVPMAELILGKDGNFYGTTSQGGNFGSGTVFKMTPAGTVKVLHSFTYNNAPAAALIQARDGSLYGTTTGSVFRVNTVPPVVTSAAAATATKGKAFSYQITATNGPTSYGVLGLPPGLHVDATTGLISGTPTGSGTKTLTLKAANAFGIGQKTLTLTIKN